MSPKVLQEADLIFWFHSYNALHEDRASVHVGIGSQDDRNDAKIWLELQIEIARHGRTLREHKLNRTIGIVEANHAYLLEAWNDYKGRASRRTT